MQIRSPINAVRLLRAACFVLLAFDAVMTAEGRDGIAVDLLGDSVDRSPINCTIDLQNGAFAALLDEADSLIDFAPRRSASQALGEGPFALSFRMRIASDVPLEEYIVYWVTGAETQWKEFARIPIVPDGDWHQYRLPLPAEGELTALRLTFGKIPHRVEIGDLGIVALDQQLPDELANVSQQSPAEAEASLGDLSITAKQHGRQIEIRDSRTERTWLSDPPCNLLTPFKIESAEHSLKVLMYDRFTEQIVSANIELGENKSARFVIEAEDYALPLSGARFYPPRFTSTLDEGRIVFCDRSCGVLLSQEDTTYASWPMRVYGNTNCLDMPWVGFYDGARGDGAMLLVESPADAEVALTADPSGNHWPEVRWLASLDAFAYPRVASLRFTDDRGHVGLAQVYRDHLKDSGRFKTLKQKAAEKPAVEQLRGAPSLWGGRYPSKFIRQMRPLGIERGIVNTCKDPGLIRWLNEMGYLTGRYDSYTDMIEGPTGFQSDDIEKTAIVSRPGGKPKHGWKLRSGKQMYWRSSAEWANAEASYTPQELALRPYNARFVDVAAAAELFEDYHPEHTLDRREDLANRRALFEKMNAYGLVLGTEHGNDWVADLVEYFEGTMSGPFWWSSWPAGYLDRPKREQLSENYLKYGMGYGHRVPLWELVFHDCANTTWYWGDTAGLLYESAPELSDRKDLFNLLYGTTPLFWMNGTGYRHPEETHRMLRTFHDTCKLHETVAFEPMTDHAFLSEDRTLQRTRFGNGTEVVVNFSGEPRKYANNDTSVMLAPYGFLANGPDIDQSKLWTDGASQTIITKPGYLTVQSRGDAFVQGVKSPGRLTTFHSNETTWNVFLDPDTEFEINIPAVTGWDASDGLSLCYMDDLGEVRGHVTDADQDGIVRFRSTEDAWRFALVKRANTDNAGEAAK